MNPSSLMSLCRDVVVRHVYYVDRVNDAFVERTGLIPLKDLQKLSGLPHLKVECGDVYFMDYFYKNIEKGMLYAARYGIHSLFVLFDNEREFKTYRKHAFGVLREPRRTIDFQDAVVIGGNLEIMKTTFSTVRYNMLYAAVAYKHFHVVDYCLSQQVPIIARTLNMAIKCNTSTSMLIKLFDRIVIRDIVDEMSLYKPDFIHSTFSKLLNELVFRRVIKYYITKNPTKSKRMAWYDNKKFNDIDYTYGLVEVCTSKNPSKQRFDKILNDIHQLRVSSREKHVEIYIIAIGMIINRMRKDK